jgi:hypothetical protein
MHWTQAEPSELDQCSQLPGSLRASTGQVRFGGHGTNFETRAWYARYASPRLLSDCASVGGMPVTNKIELSNSACGTTAIAPYGQNANPYTA